MKERPIIFSTPMVRAILAGTKTQTRRLIDVRRVRHEISWVGWSDGDSGMGWYAQEVSAACGDSPAELNADTPLRCPYGVPGDRLWVRETWGFTAAIPTSAHEQAIRERFAPRGWMAYRADAPGGNWCWRPSIHMPRWASRITLEVTDVRVQRLQDISKEDAKAEGATSRSIQEPHGARAGWSMDWSRVGQMSLWAAGSCSRGRREKAPLTESDVCLGSPQMAYAALWNEINGKRAPWESKPWVWAITFAPRPAGAPEPRQEP